MLKVKPLRKNNAGKYMYAVAMIFCLSLVAFGVAILFSPHVESTLKTIRTHLIAGDVYVINTGTKRAAAPFESVFFGTVFTVDITPKNIEHSFAIIAPSMILICYVPIGIGGALFLWLLVVTIILNVGFRNRNRHNLREVVSPIKWYALGISSVWFAFIVVLLDTFITYAAAAPLIFGRILAIETNKFMIYVLALGDKNGNKILGLLHNNKVYWFLADIFNVAGRLDEHNKLPLTVWLVPFIPLIVCATLQVSGLISGAVSWLWVNIYVLASIGDPEALKIANKRLPERHQITFIGEMLPGDRGAGSEGSAARTSHYAEPSVTVPFEQASTTIDITSKGKNETAPLAYENSRKAKKTARKAKKAFAAEPTVGTVEAPMLDPQTSTQREVDVTSREAYDAYNPGNPPNSVRTTNATMTPEPDFGNYHPNMINETEGAKGVWNNEALDGNSVLFGVNATLKSRLLTFFKNSMKMMELAQNTNNSLYRKFRVAYDALVQNRVDTKLTEIARGVEDYIAFATEADQKFVALVSRVLHQDRTVFGTFAAELGDIIAKYNNAIKVWNLYGAELMIEQIFAIASQSTQLLAKVGYTLKYRLANHYRFIDERLHGFERLDAARDTKNYDAYRQVCLQLITAMSPNKHLVTGLISQLY